MHAARLLTTFVALAATAGVATAEPFRWGYSAVDLDGNPLRSVTGLTADTAVDAFVPDPLAAGRFSADGSSDHYRREVWRSEATLTVTDEASGAAGSMALYREYIREYDLAAGGWNLLWEGETGGPWPAANEMSLGAYRYAVTAPGGEMHVAVSADAVPGGGPGPGAPAATPEPATLGLAAVGLGAVLVRRRRSTR